MPFTSNVGLIAAQSDGQGGMLVTWLRGFAIEMAHVLANGTVAVGPLTVVPEGLTRGAASGREGGFLAYWGDNPGSGLWVKWYLPDGTPDPNEPVNPRLVRPVGPTYFPFAAYTDGDGGAYLLFNEVDATSGLVNMMHVSRTGAGTQALVSFGGADVSAERVRLSWLVPDGSAIDGDVERSDGAGGAWFDLGPVSREGDRLAFEDREVTAGATYGYRLVERGGAVLDEQWVSVPPRAVLALSGASPYPVERDLWVAFSLPADGKATLELFDLRGRRIEAREVGTMGPGEHRVQLSESGHLPAGLYLVRLTREGRILTAKACVIR
jgi:hypothetical protein